MSDNNNEILNTHLQLVNVERYNYTIKESIDSTAFCPDLKDTPTINHWYATIKSSSDNFGTVESAFYVPLMPYNQDKYLLEVNIIFDETSEFGNWQSDISCITKFTSKGIKSPEYGTLNDFLKLTPSWNFDFGKICYKRIEQIFEDVK
jgi:hypothetical protein